MRCATVPPRLRRRVEALRAATVPAVWNTGPTVDAEILTVVAPYTCSACGQESGEVIDVLA